METANLGESSKSPQGVKIKDALAMQGVGSREQEEGQENLINTTVRMSPKLRSAIQAAAELNHIEFAVEIRNTLEHHYGVATSSLRHVTVQDLDDAMRCHEQLYHTVKSEKPMLPAGEMIAKPRSRRNDEISTSTILEILLEHVRSGEAITPTKLGQDPRLNMKAKAVGTKLIRIGIQAKNTRLGPESKPGRYYLPEMIPAIEDAYERAKREESSGMD